MNSVSSSSSYKNKIAYNYDFACTYHLMSDDDADMSNFLYQIQLTNAFCMQKTPGTNTDPSSMFDSSRVQNVFDYLVNVMHLYKNKKFVSIEIGDKWFSIPLDKLCIKEEQLYKFKGQGIAHILEKDIYNVSSKSDVIVKVILF